MGSLCAAQGDTAWAWGWGVWQRLDATLSVCRVAL